MLVHLNANNRCVHIRFKFCDRFTGVLRIPHRRGGHSKHARALGHGHGVVISQYFVVRMILAGVMTFVEDEKGDLFQTPDGM